MRLERLWWLLAIELLLLWRLVERSIVPLFEEGMVLMQEEGLLLLQRRLEEELILLEEGLIQREKLISGWVLSEVVGVFILHLQNQRVIKMY